MFIYRELVFVYSSVWYLKCKQKKKKKQNMCSSVSNVLVVQKILHPHTQAHYRYMQRISLNQLPWRWGQHKRKPSWFTFVTFEFCVTRMYHLFRKNTYTNMQVLECSSLGFFSKIGVFLHIRDRSFFKTQIFFFL